MSGPYYSPENYGLTIVAEIDGAGAYEFDQVVVWRDHRGELWAAHDSGCSCPTPFDGIKYPADMAAIRRVDDVRPLLAEIGEYNSPSAAEVAAFIGKVREALA